MKKFKLFSIAAFFAATLVIFMVACQKDEEPSKTNVKEVFKIENGVLVFDDFDALNQIFKSITTNPNELINFQSKLKDFKSLKSAYEDVDACQFTGLKDIKPYEEIAYWDYSYGKEPAFQSLLKEGWGYSDLFNDKGLIKIGDNFIKIGKDRKWYFFNQAHLKNEYLADPSRIPNVIIVKTLEKDGDRASCASMYCHTGSYHQKRINCETEADFLTLPIYDHSIDQIVGIIQVPSGLTRHNARHFNRCIFGAWCNSKANSITITLSGQNSVTQKDTKSLSVAGSSANSTSSATEDCGTGSCSL